MYWQEHHPPHFHALYGDFEALVDIRTLEIIRGGLPGRALALTQEWADLHRQELMEIGTYAKPGSAQTRYHPWNNSFSSLETGGN